MALGSDETIQSCPVCLFMKAFSMTEFLLFSCSLAVN